MKHYHGSFSTPDSAQQPKNHSKYRGSKKQAQHRCLSHSWERSTQTSLKASAPWRGLWWTLPLWSCWNQTSPTNEEEEEEVGCSKWSKHLRKGSNNLNAWLRNVESSCSHMYFGSCSKMMFQSNKYSKYAELSHNICVYTAFWSTVCTLIYLTNEYQWFEHCI